MLADDTRRQILAALRESGSELSVSDLVEQLVVSQPTVSKHLRVLREAGLVTLRQEGQHRYYRLIPGALAAPAVWLAQFVPAQEAEVDEVEISDTTLNRWGARLGSSAASVAGLGDQVAHLYETASEQLTERVVEPIKRLTASPRPHHDD